MKESNMRQSKSSSNDPAVTGNGYVRWLLYNTISTLRRLAVVALTVSLVACGGGSSSGGGGATLAGTYNGMATVTLSSPGLPTQTVSGTIQFVVDAQGKVTSDPGTSAPGTGTLNGNSFTVTVPAAAFNQPGMTCAGSLRLSGTIANNTMTGTFAQNGFSCNGVAINVTGSFTATRLVAASVVLPVGTNLMDSLRDAVNATR